MGRIGSGNFPAISRQTSSRSSCEQPPNPADKIITRGNVAQFKLETQKFSNGCRVFQQLQSAWTHTVITNFYL